MAGSRDMTATAATNAALSSAQAINALKIGWGGATGDQWYSDTDRTVDGVSMTGRVTSWGTARSGAGGEGGWGFGLRDDDSHVRDIAEDGGVGGRVATLYQLWVGASQADWVVLWKGITDNAMAWDESDAVAQITCLDYGRKMAAELCQRVELGDFEYAAPEAEGRALPVVYGRVRNVEPVWVNGGGPVTLTTTYLAYDASEFRVDDPTAFPASSAGSPIQLWVGREIVEGYFDAADTNRFVITDRDIALHTGTLTFDVGSYQTLNLDTTDPSGYWDGFAIGMQIYDFDPTKTALGPVQYRTIRGYTYDGGDANCVISCPLSNGWSSGDPWVINEYDFYSGYRPWKPTGNEAETLAYTIRTPKANHAVGSTVRYRSDVVFVASDAPAKSLKRLYAIGDTGERVLVPEGAYTANLDDSQFASELGRNCTTITLRLLPAMIHWAKSLRRQSLSRGFTGGEQTVSLSMALAHGSNTLVADIEGAEDGGTLVEHPADVIESLAKRSGLSAGDIDSVSVAAAKADKTGYRVSFALTEARKSYRQALDDLAMMSECAIDWTQGELRLVALTNAIDTASLAKTLGTARQFDSRSILTAGETRLVTRAVCSYTDHLGQRREVQQRDTAAIALFGDRQAAYDGWMYAHRNPCDAALSFLLYRRRYEPTGYADAAFLDALDLLPHDIVVVDGQRAWVASLEAEPGVLRVADRIGLRLLAPPADWYDATWTYPSPAYDDPPDPATEETEPALDETLTWPPAWNDLETPIEDPTYSASRSRSSSRSASGASQSRSRSSSRSASGASPSRSASSSRSASGSRLNSRSASASTSRSVSASASRSASGSRSASASASRSASGSRSSSRSASGASASRSASSSRSASASASRSASASNSRSASASRSGSASNSRSASASRSGSRSASRSATSAYDASKYYCVLWSYWTGEVGVHTQGCTDTPDNQYFNCETGDVLDTYLGNCVCTDDGLSWDCDRIESVDSGPHDTIEDCEFVC